LISLTDLAREPDTARIKRAQGKMADLTPTDTLRPRSPAVWDLMRKPGMIYVLVLTLVVITFIARSQIAPILRGQRV